jgi:hypothetical protein
MKDSNPTTAAGDTPIIRTEGFPIYCALIAQEFDLAGFDAWLRSLPSCSIKRGLSERREEAFQAMLRNEEHVALRHLEFLSERWRQERREEFLVPLARKGEKSGRAQAGRRKDKPAANPDDEGRNGRIRTFHARQVDAGNTKATATTATEFGLSTRQIRRVLLA